MNILVLIEQLKAWRTAHNLESNTVKVGALEYDEIVKELKRLSNLVSDDTVSKSKLLGLTLIVDKELDSFMQVSYLDLSDEQLIEVAWNLYCKQTAGNADVKDFWHELTLGVQQYYIGQAKLRTECDLCDGCGWYEGGEAINTFCERCEGTGYVIL